MDSQIPKAVLNAVEYKISGSTPVKECLKYMKKELTDESYTRIVARLENHGEKHEFFDTVGLKRSSFIWFVAVMKTLNEDIYDTIITELRSQCSKARKPQVLSDYEDRIANEVKKMGNHEHVEEEECPAMAMQPASNTISNLGPCLTPSAVPKPSSPTVTTPVRVSSSGMCPNNAPVVVSNMVSCPRSAGIGELHGYKIRRLQKVLQDESTDDGGRRLPIWQFLLKHGELPISWNREKEIKTSDNPGEDFVDALIESGMTVGQLEQLFLDVQFQAGLDIIQKHSAGLSRSVKSPVQVMNQSVSRNDNLTGQGFQPPVGGSALEHDSDSVCDTGASSLPTPDIDRGSEHRRASDSSIDFNRSSSPEETWVVGGNSHSLDNLIENVPRKIPVQRHKDGSMIDFTNAANDYEDAQTYVKTGNTGDPQRE